MNFDLSGLSLRVEGLDEPLERAFRERWGPFVAVSSPQPWLTIEVGAEDRAVVTGRPMRAGLKAEWLPGCARFTIDEGTIEVPEDGPAIARVATGDDAWRFWGLVNLLTAALAFRLPSRPAALVHAAGIVVDDRAFLLVGAEGTGKSTFARAAREGGARVVGDDTVLVDAADGALVLLGSPVRAHEAWPGGPGRWPVAAILLARHGVPARLDPARRVEIEARLAAGLPYLVAGIGRDPRLEALVPTLAAGAAHRTLTFGPDPAFLEVLREFRS